MGFTNYPNGFPHGVTIRGIPILSMYPGKVWWVHSVTGGDGNPGTTPEQPFKTLDYAVCRCTAGNGDIIVCMPGHVETVVAAGGLALDVADICIVGLGAGSSRPTINFTTSVNADMNVDAANISMYNILFLGGIDALVAPIDVNAADFTLTNCEYRDVTGQATDVILGDANADRLWIENYYHNGAAAAGANSAIALNGSDNPVIKNFKIVGNFAVGAIDVRTAPVVDADISNGYIWTKNSADLCIIDTITTSTGKIGPNLLLMLTDNAANITEAITGATWHMFDDIFVCNLVNEKAMLINKTASTDA